jgi:hypothetical protein
MSQKVKVLLLSQNKIIINTYIKYIQPPVSLVGTVVLLIRRNLQWWWFAVTLPKCAT